MVFEIGRLCMKIAGRDAELKCVIIDVLDDNYVLIDGQARRRKCNIKHLEPLKDKIKIKKQASHNDVVKAFKKLKIEIKETKPKQKTERPKKQKKEKIQIADETEKVEKKVVKEKTVKKTKKTGTKTKKKTTKKETKKKK